MPENELDWDFWGLVINEYENIIRTKPRQYTANLHKGIPGQVFDF
jgi:hypothetical protein